MGEMAAIAARRLSRHIDQAAEGFLDGGDGASGWSAPMCVNVRPSGVRPPRIEPGRLRARRAQTG
jgi:hypothetical protein